MKDINPIHLIEGYGNFIEGHGIAVEGVGLAISLNPVRLSTETFIEGDGYCDLNEGCGL